MGQLFGSLTNQNTALLDPNSGHALVIGKPEDVLKMAPKPPTDMLGSPTNQQMPAIGKPSFTEAAQAGAKMPGTANVASPGLSKAGKLVTLLTSGLQGAMAGQAASEQAVMASGGHRSGGFGTGFQAAQQMPFLRAQEQNQLAQQQAQTELTKAQGQMVQTPYGPLPAIFAKALLPAQIGAESRENVAKTHAGATVEAAKIGAQSRENVAAGKLAATPPHTIRAGNGQLLQWNPELKNYTPIEGTANAPGNKMGSIPPEIYAQLGQPPLDDPDKLRAWGAAAEAIKNREAASQGMARGQAYGAFRPVQAINPETGNYEWMYANQAIGGGAAPAGPGGQSMSKQAQFGEMHFAVDQTRNAVQQLDKPFDAQQIAKLTLAMREDDPTIFNNEVQTMLGSQQLTPAQQDLVVWLGQLNERALSLRNVAGMGQGSDQLRNAIRQTLPSIRSGSKEMMNKQLAAFDNQVRLLEKGVPGVKGSQAQGGNQKFTPPPGAKVRDYTQLGQ